MAWFVEMRNTLICPIDRDRVLDQVVRSDTEEIYLARQQIRHDSGAGHLDHDANLKFVVERMAFSWQLVPASIDDLQAAPHLLESGDHREHHLDVRPDT